MRYSFFVSNKRICDFCFQTAPIFQFYSIALKILILIKKLLLVGGVRRGKLNHFVICSNDFFCYFGAYIFYTFKPSQNQTLVTLSLLSIMSVMWQCDFLKKTSCTVKLVLGVIVLIGLHGASEFAAAVQKKYFGESALKYLLSSVLSSTRMVEDILADHYVIFSGQFCNWGRITVH